MRKVAVFLAVMIIATVNLAYCQETMKNLETGQDVKTIVSKSKADKNTADTKDMKKVGSESLKPIMKDLKSRTQENKPIDVIQDFNPPGPDYMRDLGGTRPIEDLMQTAVYNEHAQKIYMGTNPNGHIYENDPLNFPENLMDLGITRPDSQENYIWTMCSAAANDPDANMIYGGTCQGAPGYIYVYDTDAHSITERDEISSETYIRSSANTRDYVYFGTMAGGKLLKCKKDTTNYGYFQQIDEIIPPFSYGDSANGWNIARLWVQTNFPLVYDSLTARDSCYDGEHGILCLTAGPNGMIYGGTINGFVFKYNPETNQFTNVLNINYENNLVKAIGDVSWIVANDSRIFASVNTMPPIGNFYRTVEIDFNQTPQARRLLYQPNGDSTIAGANMVIVNDTLYIRDIYNAKCIKYDMTTNTAVLSAWQLDVFNYVAYTDTLGNDFLVAFKSLGSYEKYFYKMDLTNGGPLVPHLMVEPDPVILPSGGSKFRSLAASDSNVYGGVYFTGGFIRHSISEDLTSDSLFNIGYCGGANADAMYASDSLCYYGYYASLGLGIYDPRLPWSPATDSGGTPNATHNPLLRSLKVMGHGEPRTDTLVAPELKRVNSITKGVDTSGHQWLYIGTGPMWFDEIGDDAWLMGFDTNDGNIVHIKKLDANFIGNGDHVPWIEDLDYYQGYLFMTGSGQTESWGLIIQMNPAQVANKIGLGGSRTTQTITVDSTHDRLYLSNDDSLKIYRLSQVLSNNPIEGFCGTCLELGMQLNGTIWDVVNGNDGNVYIGYGQSVGRINPAGTFLNISDLPSDSYRLAVSTDTQKQNIYVGSIDGHMYAILRQNFVNITSSSTATAIEDSSFSYVATATNVDGITPSKSFHQYPSWLHVSANTISGTPLEPNHDTSFVVIATDGFSADTLNVAVSVTQVNDPPVITSPTSATATWPGTFSYTATATDPDNSTLTYNYISHPNWLSDTSATISGMIPGVADDTSFTVTVSDSQLSDTLIVSLHIARNCNLVAGDANCDGAATGQDVIFLTNYFSQVGPPPPCTCYCPSALRAGGDANGNCILSGQDVTYLVRFFKGLGPAPKICSTCVEARLMPPIDIPKPTIKVRLEPLPNFDPKMKKED